MNRRNFIKLTGIASISFPYLSLGQYDKKKRDPKSLFTIEQLKTWCDKNGFHYVEDNEIIFEKHGEFTIKKYLDKETQKKFWLYNRWPFCHKNSPKDWQETLNYKTVEYKISYERFFLHDIVETTLDFQKEDGDFYSMWNCAKLTNDLPWREELKLEQTITKVYDVVDRRWLTTCFSENGWFTGFKNV